MYTAIAPAPESAARNASVSFDPLAGIALPGAAQTATSRAWRLRRADADIVAALCSDGALSPTLARVLAARDVTPENAQTYLNPSLRESMPDPLILKDMDLAVDRLARAVRAGETIGVFGDYDVDGTTASAILKRYFDMLGAPSLVHLPDRILEGYGPSAEAFASMKTRGADLIVTVDCGASAYEPIAHAARLGVDVVVLDHHLMQGSPPAEASAVVNPNRADDASGLTNLSAAGLAFMAAAGLNRALRAAGFFNGRVEPDIRGLLDLAALGLVCDVMPMRGLARVIVAQGLKVLSAGADGPGAPGLQALAEACGARAPYSAYHLGFMLGPRINAAGRIGHAGAAFELLTTDDAARRRDIANELHQLNAARQEIEAQVQEEAIAQIEKRALADRPLNECPVIVAAGENWHPGVVGIVAGRLKEKYDRPAIVIGLENGRGKGSGRSLDGVDLGAAVSAARAEGLLVAGGGHAMAAGLTIDEDALDAFTAYLDDRLAGDVEKARAARVRHIDGVLAPSAVSRAFADDIARAGPFGPGNPEPVFVLPEMTPVVSKPVGAGHLAVTLKNLAGETVRGIAFRVLGEPLGDLLSNAQSLHVAGRVKADDFRGGEAAQLQIVDAAPASGT